MGRNSVPTVPYTSIRVSRDHTRELELLRLSWDLRTADDVIGKLLETARPEEIGALNIVIGNGLPEGEP